MSVDSDFLEFLQRHKLDNTPIRRSVFEVVYPTYLKAASLEKKLEVATKALEKIEKMYDSCGYDEPRETANEALEQINNWK